jgi:hypothetical protein
VCVVVSVHGLAISCLIRRLFAFCRLCAVIGGKSCACLSAIRSTSLLAWPLPIASNNRHAASIPGLYYVINTIIQSDLPGPLLNSVNQLFIPYCFSGF